MKEEGKGKTADELEIEAKAKIERDRLLDGTVNKRGEKKPKTKKDKEKLAVKLTDEELREYGDQLAKVERRRTCMEIDAANTAKRLKAEIAMQVAEIARLAQLVESKEELRDVEVEIKFNVPREGLKTIMRLDTNEIVREDIMPSYEKEDLFINAPEDEGSKDEDQKPVSDPARPWHLKLLDELPVSKINANGVADPSLILDLVKGVKGVTVEIRLAKVGLDPDLGEALFLVGHNQQISIMGNSSPCAGESVPSHALYDAISELIAQMGIWLRQDSSKASRKAQEKLNQIQEKESWYADLLIDGHAPAKLPLD